LEKLYSTTGPPSIAPERLIRALLLQVLYAIRSERRLVEWQKSGASFELVELHVEVGDAIAYAYALLILICASRDERANNPDRRLRLTIGCAKGAVDRSARASLVHP
jgi:Transposase domain (DUF772)